MKATVLLVEDEEDTHELLGRALERAGYGALLVAPTAEQALAGVSDAPGIDVVVKIGRATGH